MQRRGGQLILVAPQPEVMKVLEVTGVLGSAAGGVQP